MVCRGTDSEHGVAYTVAIQAGQHGVAPEDGYTEHAIARCQRTVDNTLDAQADLPLEDIDTHLGVSPATVDDNALAGGRAVRLSGRVRRRAAALAPDMGDHIVLA